LDKTLVKGLQVIELLAGSDRARGVSELARELELTKSNVHRLLTTLLAQGYVRKLADNSAYELTSKIWEIGSQVHSRLDVIKVAREAMVKLERETGESVHLSILDGREVVYVDKLDGSHPIKAYTTIGGRAPVWCVATGKALLAFAPASVVEDVASSLTSFTEPTIVTRKDLVEELESIRRSGYAVNNGEWRDGVAGLAAPVRNSSGNVVAAIGISGPAIRFRQKDIKARAIATVDAALEVSAALGYRLAETIDRTSDRRGPGR